MIFFRKAVCTIGLLTVLGGGSLFADSISQIKQFGPAPTDVGGTGQTATDQSFYYFQSDPLTPSGAILDSVNLRITIGETVSTLSFSNTGSNSAFWYSTTAGFHIGGTDNAADLAAIRLGNGVGGSGSAVQASNYNLFTIGDAFDQQTINTGETINYLPTMSTTIGGAPIDTSLVSGTGTYAYDSGLVTSANTALYNTTGTFTLNYATGTDFAGGGGLSNLTTNQTTNTNARFEVDYNYHTADIVGTPEPATCLLMATALVGFGLRKRFKA